jgi:tetratricopeptide (TPR) repeat protein
MNFVTEKILFRSEELAIDFFSWGGDSDKNIAITFTPFGTNGEISLDGVGYGGEFLLSNNFDIVAIKSAKNLWYQNLSMENIALAEQFISSYPTKYMKRVGYGSSMGGYAAIQFSRALKLDIVLALSPQFEIDQPYDQRWASAAQGIQFQHRIDPTAIANDCKYFIAYDPQTVDVRHVEKIREFISHDQLVEITTPYAGHPSAYYLAETGQIQELAISVLKNGSIGHARVNAHRARSKTYLYELSKRLTLKNKNESALLVIDRALAIDPNVSALLLQKSIVLNNLGRFEAALKVAHEARQKLNNETHLMASLSVHLVDLQDYSGGLELIEQAISIENNVFEFHLHRCKIHQALGNISAAISAGEYALQLSPINISLMKLLLKLHLKHGGWTHWARSAVLAKNLVVEHSR